MKVICIGDVVGNGGCEFLRVALPILKKKIKPDLVLVNGENSAQGNGILPSSASHIFDSGADVITTGNHGLKRREIFEMMERDLPLIRPANFHSSAPGRGVTVIDTLKCRIGVINLMGVAFLEPLDNPFETVDRLLKEISADIILVDFHGEATAEKLAMGYYLDGRVSLVVGTHTHVPTADEMILPKGTGYVTDLGMCGGKYSVLGVKPELAIQRLKTHLPTRFENDEGIHRLSGIVAEIDEKTGRCLSIERISYEEPPHSAERR